MPLWLAGLLIAVCVGAIVFFSVKRRKSKKAMYIVFIVLTALICAAMLGYFGLAWIFLTADDSPPPLPYEDPNWRGSYSGKEFDLYINNFDGDIFRFFFSERHSGNAECVFEGIAPLDPDNSFMAEYWGVTFLLDADSISIEISVAKGSEWEIVGGLYLRD